MEKFTLYTFWTFMLTCASLVIIGVWWGEHNAPEALFKAAFTCFVVGFANFLIWLPTITYRFLDK